MALCPRESRWITHIDSPQTTDAPCFCYKFLLVEIIPVLPILSPSFAESPSYESLVYASPRGRVNVVEQSAVGAPRSLDRAALLQQPQQDSATLPLPPGNTFGRAQECPLQKAGQYPWWNRMCLRRLFLLPLQEGNQGI